MANILNQRDNKSDNGISGNDGNHDGRRNGFLSESGFGSLSKMRSEEDLYEAAFEPSMPPFNGSKRVSTPVSRQESSESVASSLHPHSDTALPALGSFKKSGTRRYCCYIGNMTWWTTDADLHSLIISCGVDDLLDIRIYENKSNGQSKGFALAVFEEESAVQELMQKLPLCSLHGQKLAVLPFTKSSLAMLEDAVRPDQRSDKKETKNEEANIPFVGTVRIGVPPQSAPPVLMSPLHPPMAVRPHIQAPPVQMLSSMPLPILSSAQIPLMIAQQQQQPQLRGPPPPPNSQQLSMGANMIMIGPPMNFASPPPPIPPLQLGGGPAHFAAVPPMNRPPPMIFPHVPQEVSPRSAAGSMPEPLNREASRVLPPPLFPPSGTHINPQGFGQPAINAPVRSSVEGLSEAEFEEIMNRNRTVSSSAITRAVCDAAVADFPSAIETLDTAISLIKQSKVANDDRCKVLISSLQDTRNGIESKWSSRKHRSSARDRSRSPAERSRKRAHRSHSSKSPPRSHQRTDDHSPRHSSSSDRRRAY